jgi:hypothetical protein
MLETLPLTKLVVVLSRSSMMPPTIVLLPSLSQEQPNASGHATEEEGGLASPMWACPT